MKHWHRLLIVLLVMIALAVAVALIAPGGHDSLAAGRAIYVDADATGANNGSSWADAFTDLQLALADAAVHDHIWVAAGIYKPTGGTDRAISFAMKNGVAISGGFDPSLGDVAWEDRDWVANVTILSGDVGTEGDNSDNSYHVFYHPEGTDLDSTAILDGFTVTGGNADGVYPLDLGGGMLNYGSSPALTNCIFASNSAGTGGGMVNFSSSSPVLTNCTFSGNSAEGGGGAIYNWDSSPLFANCAFSVNSANSGGGGMANHGNSSPTLTNCTFSDNSAGYRGGGMYNESSSPVLTNCTFSGNSADLLGGGMHNYTSSPVLSNCILWGDTPQEIFNDDPTSSPVVTYSDVQGGYEGVGNIDADPLFVDAANGDFHLGTDSPCVDVGDNEAPALPYYDFEGDERILDGAGDAMPIVDMGVDEKRVYYVDADATGLNDGSSWANAFTDLQPPPATAVARGEIWVAAGTYKPTWQFEASDPRSATFQMKNGVAIYGGFDPSVGDDEWTERDWETHVTILSGDIGAEGDPADNCYHVFYHPEGIALGASAILDGFTITGANADGAWPHDSGGAMVNIASSPALANCTFEGNSAQYGGGVCNYSGSSPALTGCTFADNSAGWGGGMHNYLNSAPTLSDCTFSNNSALYHGGGMYNYWYAAATLTNCTFTSNSADHGGGMYNANSASPELTNCTFDGNSAANAGGGMFSYDSSPVLTDCTFSNNSADLHGGGMQNDTSSPVLNGCTFEGNDAGETGGGMFNTGSSPELTNCTFFGNWSGYDGGGIYNLDSSPVLNGCAFTSNWTGLTGKGGGMRNNNSSPTLTDCTFTNNWADAEGGGMYNWESSPALTNCTFTANLADMYGGGMANSWSSPTLTGCAFEENSADSGGGMYNANSLSPVLTDCTFTGNSAGNDGGGMHNFNSSPILTNCSFSGNSTGLLADEYGGGMYNYGSSPTLTNCTFTGNSAYFGGALFNTDSSSPTLTNCILWADTVVEIYNYDPSSTPAVSYSDIQGGCSAPFNVCGDGNIDADPLFVDAATDNFHLGPGSPCIDAGHNAAPNLPVYDFEGDARIIDGDGDGTPVVDMGVDEARIRAYLPLVLKGY